MRTTTSSLTRLRRRVHAWGCTEVHPTRYGSTLIAFLIGCLIAIAIYTVLEQVHLNQEADRRARESRAELRQRDRELAAALARLRALERVTPAELRRLLDRMLDELDEPLRRRLGRIVAEEVRPVGGNPPPPGPMRPAPPAGERRRPSP